MELNRSSRKWWVFAGLSLGTIVVYIDFTIVNTALPAIQRDLKVSFVELQWVMNAFVLALCIFIANMGRFGDAFGRRLMLYIGLGLFGGASVFGGLAPNGFILIIARAIQGIGSSIIIPSSLALVSNTFPENERGRAIGIWASMIGIGLSIGPVLGGMITSALSWRWIFFVNIPIVILAVIICLLSLKETIKQEEGRRIDWYGLLLMIIGLGTLVSAIIQGPEWGWTSIISIAFFIIAIISLVALYFVENKVTSPIIDFRLFANRGFLSGACANYTMASFAYAAFFLMPLYLKNIIGEQPYKIGILLVPITVLMAIVAPIPGRIIDFRDAKIPILLGLASLAVSAIV
jgi:EmrB/QacA subfamily drug resistance transporter